MGIVVICVDVVSPSSKFDVKEIVVIVVVIVVVGEEGSLRVLGAGLEETSPSGVATGVAKELLDSV